MVPANQSFAAMLFRMQMQRLVAGEERERERESTLPFLERANPVLCYADEARALLLGLIDSVSSGWWS